MNLLRLIDLSLAHNYYSNYCSNLVSNHGLIRLIRFVSQFISKLCNLFVIYLDLILLVCKILFRCDYFRILNFATKQDPGLRRDVLPFYGHFVTERLYGGPVSGWAFLFSIDFSSSPGLGLRSPDSSPHSAEKNRVDPLSSNDDHFHEDSFYFYGQNQNYEKNFQKNQSAH